MVAWLVNTNSNAANGNPNGYKFMLRQNKVAAYWGRKNAVDGLDEKPTSKVIAMRPYKRFMQIAAAVAVLLTGSYFYLGTLGQNFSTQYAELKEITLPDNSEIVLNADSEISYDDKNWDEKRNIDLDGEAFFKVAKGKTFTVSTDDGTIAVLGTQFNVENRDGFFEVTCFEGLVSVTYKDTVVKLPQGTIFKVINGVVDSVSTFDVNERSWLQKESNFKSTPLRFVIGEIENQFDYKIETKDIDLDVLYSGGFSHSDINLAMQSVTIPLQLSYKIEDKTSTILVFY